MRLPKWLVRIANEITKFSLLIGIPRRPYTRANALIVETVGHRSGKCWRIPAGSLDDGGHIIVVVEDCLRAHGIRNALANDTRPRIHFQGAWHEARLRILETDPESYLNRMNRAHAGFVRLESTTPAVVEIVLE